MRTMGDPHTCQTPCLIGLAAAETAFLRSSSHGVHVLGSLGSNQRCLIDRAVRLTGRWPINRTTSFARARGPGATISAPTVIITTAVGKGITISRVLNARLRTVSHFPRGLATDQIGCRVFASLRFPAACMERKCYGVYVRRNFRPISFRSHLRFMKLSNATNRFLLFAACTAPARSGGTRRGSSQSLCPDENSAAAKFCGAHPLLITANCMCVTRI